MPRWQRKLLANLGARSNCACKPERRKHSQGRTQLRQLLPLLKLDDESSTDAGGKGHVLLAQLTLLARCTYEGGEMLRGFPTKDVHDRLHSPHWTTSILAVSTNVINRAHQRGE